MLLKSLFTLLCAFLLISCATHKGCRVIENNPIGTELENSQNNQQSEITLKNQTVENIFRLEK